jgi:recombinational DNA repair protein (RecF pathway)
MARHRIQVGQIWKKMDTGESYIVTKVFTEALTTYAVLRKTGAETESRLRVRVTYTGEGQQIVGFTLATNVEEL